MSVRSRVFDLLWAMPMILLYGVFVYGVGQRIVETLRADRFPLMQSVTLLTDALTVISLVLVIVIFFVRRLPVARLAGRGAWLVAMIASNFEFLIVVLPRAGSSPVRDFISAALLTVGLAGGIYVLSVLGRSFSILPQARGLVTRGPYRVVRHPLYLAGMIAALGIMLQFEQPWAVLITGTGFGLQLWRMRYEERVLSDCHPEYRSYAATTARLLPGIY